MEYPSSFGRILIRIFFVVSYRGLRLCTFAQLTGCRAQNAAGNHNAQCAQPKDLAKTLSFDFNKIQFSNAFALMTAATISAMYSLFAIILFVVTIIHSPFTFRSFVRSFVCSLLIHIQNELMLSFNFHSALCFSHSLI